LKPYPFFLELIGPGGVIAELVFQPVPEIFFTIQIFEPRIARWIIGMIIRRQSPFIRLHHEIAAHTSKCLPLNFLQAAFKVSLPIRMILQYGAEVVDFLQDFFCASPQDQPITVPKESCSESRQDRSKDWCGDKRTLRTQLRASLERKP
jgi:hypothetical protein